jgi:hypothetical protein
VLGCPEGEAEGEQEVVVVSAACGCVGVVAGVACFDPEVEELVDECWGVGEACGDLDSVLLEEDGGGGDQVSFRTVR